MTDEILKKLAERALTTADIDIGRIVDITPPKFDYEKDLVRCDKCGKLTLPGQRCWYCWNFAEETND